MAISSLFPSLPARRTPGLRHLFPPYCPKEEKSAAHGRPYLTNRILGFVNPPVVGQHIMAAALGSQVDLTVYAARREAMGEVLGQAGYEFQMPAGAFYFFPSTGGGDVAFL